MSPRYVLQGPPYHREEGDAAMGGDAEYADDDLYAGEYGVSDDSAADAEALSADGKARAKRGDIEGALGLFERAAKMAPKVARHFEEKVIAAYFFS